MGSKAFFGGRGFFFFRQKPSHSRQMSNDVTLHPSAACCFCCFAFCLEKNNYVGTEAGRGCLVLPLPIGINLMLFGLVVLEGIQNLHLSARLLKKGMVEKSKPLPSYSES